MSGFSSGGGSSALNPGGRIPLLLLDVGGQPAGFAINAGPMTVTLWDGTERVFGIGAQLDALPGRAAPLFDSVAGTDQVHVTIDRSALDLWALRETVPTQSITGRLFWWPEGDILRPEHEIFRGAVRNPTHRRSGDAGFCDFDLAPSRRTDDVPFPPTAIGDAGRFTAAPDESRGAAVPVVYGTVRGLPLHSISDAAADPQRLIVAGHRIVSTTLDIYRDGVAVDAGAPVLYGIDALGGAYAFVDLAKVDYDAGANLYTPFVVGWAAPGGGPVDKLGDVLEHLFRTYGGATWCELDLRRVTHARVPLNRFRVGFFANDRGGDGTALRLIESRLAGQFPFVAGFAGGRYGWDATVFPDEGTVLPVATLIFGHDATERVGPTETSVDDVVTSMELDYATDGYQGAAVLPLRFDDGNSGDCRRAHSRWGRSPLFRQDAGDCPDEGTAYTLLTDEARKRSVVRPRVEYRGLDPSWFDLPLAVPVLVTDADLGWVAEAFVLEAVQPRLDGLCDAVLLGVEGQ